MAWERRSADLDNPADECIQGDAFSPAFGADRVGSDPAPVRGDELCSDEASHSQPGPRTGSSLTDNRHKLSKSRISDRWRIRVACRADHETSVGTDPGKPGLPILRIIIHLDATVALRKMKWRDLAERMGIKEHNISLLKLGKVKGIRFQTRKKICEVLEARPGDLLEVD